VCQSRNFRLPRTSRVVYACVHDDLDSSTVSWHSSESSRSDDEVRMIASERQTRD
jgi:hypothetical protein